MRGAILLAAISSLLAGCGGSGDPASNNAAAAAAEANNSQAALPAGIEAPGLDCNRFRPQAAPRGQPADDLAGLRPGMTQEQVRGVLQCRNASYAINVSQRNIDLEEGGQISRVDVTADTGLDRVTALLLGPVGGERLIQINRVTEYAPGKALPLATIAQEVAAKYGQFDDSSAGNRKSGHIVRARDGQRIAGSNSSYEECSNHAVRTDRVAPCLHVISYEVTPDDRNPALASRLIVGVTSHAVAGQAASLNRQKQQQDAGKAKEKAAEGAVDL